MKTFSMKTIMLNTVTLVALLALSACSGTPKKIDSLESARSDYIQASANEVVVKHSASELDDARNALAQADRAWKKDGKRGKAEHYAYVASKKISIAKLISQRKEDDAALENMNLERQRVQLDVRSAEVDRAKQETLALQQQLEDMQAQVTARGIVATLSDVLFDIGEASLKESAMGNLDKIAKFMHSFPERNAIVEGHTDNMGNDDFNLDLSRERAFSVRTALVNRGIDAGRIVTRNLGESVPVADNNTSAGRQQNRRVEIIFPDVGTQMSHLADQ